MDPTCWDSIEGFCGDWGLMKSGYLVSEKFWRSALCFVSLENMVVPNVVFNLVPNISGGEKRKWPAFVDGLGSMTKFWTY